MTIQDKARARDSRAAAEDHVKQQEAVLAAAKQAAAQFGQQLGQPVDFSQGVDLAEKRPMPAPPAPGTVREPVRPNVPVPRPPEYDMREEAERAQREAEAQRTAHARALQDAGVPGPGFGPGPQDPGGPGGRPAGLDVQAVRSRKRPVHPLLAQLRHEFGVAGDQKPTVDVRVADHTWTFCQLTPDMIALAARMADTIAVTASEHGIRSQHAAVCCSVVAVDGVPVWQVVGEDPGPQDDVTFPLVPRGNIRQRAAVKFFAELIDGMKFRLVEALYEAYVAKVDRAESVRGYTSYEQVDHVTWVCTTLDCDHRIVRARRYRDDGTAVYPFCELHGSPMVDVAVTKPRVEGDTSPLP
jgi:hypothetical protein